jgi:hypothetical protein
MIGCLFACTGKQKMAGEKAAGADLTGTWELTEAQNGMMPNAIFPPGNGTQYVFTETAFEQYRDKQLVRKGSYRLVLDTSVSATVGLVLPGGEFPHRIIFDNDTTEKTFIDVRGNKLTLISGYFPVDSGTRQTFTKKENNR